MSMIPGLRLDLQTTAPGLSQHPRRRTRNPENADGGFAARITARSETTTRRAIQLSRIDRAAGPACLVATLALSAAACFRRIWTTDFWWQYATGRLVAEQGWPRVDVLTYTAPGAPWIEMRWLYCLGQYELMEHVGPAALVLAKWVAFGAALALFALPFARSAGAVATAALATIAILASTERLLVRPELCTWVFAAIFAAVLHRQRRRPGPALCALPALQIVWANTHPTFVLGPLLVALALCAAGWEALRRREPASRAALRPLGLALALCVAACAVNPYGLRGMLVPLAQFAQLRQSVFAEVISEMQSPFSFGFGQAAILWYVLLIGVCLATAAANLRHLDPFWLLLCASQLYLSTIAVRNLPLFALAAVPFALSNLGRARRIVPLPGAWRSSVRRATAAAVVGTCAYYSWQLATDRFSLRQNDSKQAGFGVARHRFPMREADFLASRDGRVFATLLESSYLTSRGVPVFADPRGDVHADALFRRYLAAQRDAEQWRAVVREYDVRYAMAALDSAFLDLLHADGEWRLAFFGTVAAVYERADAAGGPAPIATSAEFDRVLDLARQDLPPAVAWQGAGPLDRVSIPKPYLLLAELCLRYGRLDAASALLEEAAAASPFLRGIPHRRAAIAQARGDYPAALEQATAALAETPDDAQVLYAIGEAHFHLGALDEARSWLRRAAERRPGDAATWSLLGRIGLMRGDIATALADLRQAATVAPGDPRHRAALAAALAANGRRAEALALLDAALASRPGDPVLLRTREAIAAHASSEGP